MVRELSGVLVLAVIKSGDNDNVWGEFAYHHQLWVHAIVGKGLWDPLLPLRLPPLKVRGSL